MWFTSSQRGVPALPEGFAGVAGVFLGCSAQSSTVVAVVQERSERDRLLDRVVDHCLEFGVADLTLRSVARSTGSNNRMLLYYFESKEQMIAAALRRAGERFPLIVGALVPLDDTNQPLEFRLNACWSSLSAPENLPFIHLFFEVFGLASREAGRFDTFLQRVGRDWAHAVSLALAAEGVPLLRARTAGREIVALWRGLQFDLLSTGEFEVAAAAHTNAVRALVADLTRDVDRGSNRKGSRSHASQR